MESPLPSRFGSVGGTDDRPSTRRPRLTDKPRLEELPGASLGLRLPRRFRLALIVIAVTLLAIAGCAGGVLWYVSRDLPDYRRITLYKPPAGRPFVAASAMPPMLIDAFLAAEDRDFYTHPGIDIPYILRAMLIDTLQIGSDRRPIGASTITQQVVRLFLLSDERTLERKLKEIVLALRIEHVLSKDRILELYLNEIYLGCGAQGVVAAAQTYFDKPLDQLSVEDAAFLGGLPRAPTHYNPWRFPVAARDRRNWVIDRMVEDGYITTGQANAAKAAPLSVRPYRASKSCAPPATAAVSRPRAT
jgi:penicillin-binding protein 1A